MSQSCGYPCCTYIRALTHTFTYAYCLPLHTLLRSPYLADTRLEEQLSKATLGADNTRSSRTHGQKCGRSSLPSPEPRGRLNRHLANRSARQACCSPSPARHSRQASPHRDTKRRRTAKPGAEPQQFFQAGAVGNGALSACTICLGHRPHDVYNCASTTLWDGAPACCQKNGQGCLVNPAGNILCSNWQWPNGCPATTHDSRHECSGCGKLTHGAQGCPRAQKA